MITEQPCARFTRSETHTPGERAERRSRRSLMEYSAATTARRRRKPLVAAGTLTRRTPVEVSLSSFPRLLSLFLFPSHFPVLPSLLA